MEILMKEAHKVLKNDKIPMCIIFFLVLVSFLSLVRYLPSTQAQDTRNSNQAQAPTEKNSPKQDDPEIATLRAQLQIIRDYNDDFLSTVHWSLATVFTVVALLIGFSWYANFRLSARERAALKQELQGSLREEIANLQQQLQTDVESRFTSFKAEAEKLHGTITKSATSAGEAAAQKLKEPIASLRQDVYSLKIDVLEMEAEKWEAQKVLSNAFDRYIEIIPLAKRTGGGYILTSALDNINRLLKNGVEVDAESARNLLRVLESLPEEFSVVSDGIRDLLRKTRS